MFESDKLNDLGKAKVEEIRVAFGHLMMALTGANPYPAANAMAGVARNSPCPNSREFSLAKTKLEEACMWAIKSVATDPSNCE